MKEEIKRILSSHAFLACTLILFVTFQGYSFPTLFYERFHPLVVHDPEGWESAATMIFGSFAFGSISLILPVCGSYLGAKSQIADIHDGILPCLLIRASRRRYMFIKAVSAFVCGAFSGFLAFGSHMILWHLISKPYDLVRWPELDGVFQGIYQSIQHIGYGLPVYVLSLVGFAFVCGCWSTIGVCLGMLVPDSLLVLLLTLSIKEIWNRSLYLILKFTGVFFLAVTDTLFNDPPGVPNMLASMLIYLCLIAILLIFYWKKLRPTSSKS